MSTDPPTSREQVAKMLRVYISETITYDDPDTVLNNDSKLIEQGIIDSMGIFQVIGYIEERLGINIDPEEVVIENFASIDAIVQFVFAKYETKAS